MTKLTERYKVYIIWDEGGDFYQDPQSFYFSTFDEAYDLAKAAEKSIGFSSLSIHFPGTH